MSRCRWRIMTFQLRRACVLTELSEDYIQTLGVNFMEKAITIRNTEITFSVSRQSTCGVCARLHRRTDHGQCDGALSTGAARHDGKLSLTRPQIWDLGGQREFVSMLPLVSNDAVAILFMFDLTRKSTLNSVKEWYRQARGFNKVRVWRWGWTLERSADSPPRLPSPS